MITFRIVATFSIPGLYTTHFIIYIQTIYFY